MGIFFHSRSIVVTSRFYSTDIMSVTVTVEVVETVFAINPVVGIVTLVGGAVVIGVIALFSRSSSSSSQQETREAQTPELEENDAMTFRNANEEMFPRSVFGDNTSRQNCPYVSLIQTFT